MAFEGPQLTIPGLKAGADLSALQFYFVKLNADLQVIVCAATTDIPLGVLQNAPKLGYAAEVLPVGVTKVSADAALTAGQLIGTSVDGQAAAYVAGTDTTKYACGQVLKGASGAAALATAFVNCASGRMA